MKTSVIFLCIFTFSMPAVAQFFYYTRSKSKGFDLSAHYLTISDAKADSSATPTPVPPMVMVELGIRLYHTFNLIVTAGQSMETTETADEKTSSFGLGMKIHTPGFFFMGARKRHLVNNEKKKPFNTSVYGIMLANQTTKAGVSSNNYAMVVGLELDVFVISKSYIKLNAEVHNKQGDFFTALGGGLGWEF